MNQAKPRRSSFKRALFIPDLSRRMHFLQPQNLGNSSHQFGDFQSWVISSSVRELEPAGLTLACLIAFDGIASDTELQAAYAACQQARNLRVWTTLALARVQEWQPYGLAREHLMGVLSARALKSGVVSPLETIWEQLLTTAMGWLQNHLPPVLYGHVSGADPLSATPRSALARAQTRRALLPEEVDPPTPSGTASADQRIKCQQA